MATIATIVRNASQYKRRRRFMKPSFLVYWDADFRSFTPMEYGSQKKTSFFEEFKNLRGSAFICVLYYPLS
jgi:hypothetical protein